MKREGMGIVLVGVGSLLMLLSLGSPDLHILGRFLGGLMGGITIGIGAGQLLFERDQDREDRRARVKADLAEAILSPTTSPAQYQAASRQILSMINQAHINVDPNANYCSDCGAKYVPWTRQSGFNAVTGEPNILTFNACPDWNKERSDAELSARINHRLSSTNSSFRMPSPEMFVANHNCGNAVVTDPVSSMHNGHLPDEVDADCSGCIEQMVQDGIITRAQAAQRSA